MDTINKTLAQAYLDMYETKTKRESWVPEAVADEDVADFMGAAAAAAKAGKKEFKFGDKTYKVTMKKSTVDAIGEASECEQCGEVHEGSCNKKRMKESAEELDENIQDKKAVAAMKAIIDGMSMDKAVLKFGVSPKKLQGMMKKFTKMHESPEEPRAKGEKEFKKMHDDNTEIVDEKDGEDETFDNIKKSADAIKK